MRTISQTKCKRGEKAQREVTVAKDEMDTTITWASESFEWQ
jgi:hypothetical protein